MKSLFVVLLTLLVVLTGPDGQLISLNPNTVVTTRAPRSTEHFAPGIKCLIHTIDGKFIAVQEDCDTVKNLIEE